MKTLIIDTSTEKAIVAFANKRELLISFSFSGIESSQLLFPFIESGLKELNMPANAIGAVAVGVGPGSFTGTRVGVCAAEGIAFPRKLPLVGFCSLSGFISSNEGKFFSAIDARVGGVYLLPQERKENKVIELDGPKLVSKEDVIELARVHEIVGPSFLQMGIKGSETYPDAAHLAKVAWEKLQNYEKKPLKILYLRESPYSVLNK